MKSNGLWWWQGAWCALGLLGLVGCVSSQLPGMFANEFNCSSDKVSVDHDARHGRQ